MLIGFAIVVLFPTAVVTAGYFTIALLSWARGKVEL